MSLVDEVIGATPVIGQAQGFIKVAKNVSNATSVTGAVVSGVKTIALECAPPQIKYPLKCAALVVQTAICVGSLTNPLTAPFSFSLLIGTGTQILEEIL